MLLDTLTDSQPYLKATLLQCLSEAKANINPKITATYKTVLRRERAGVAVYKDVVRDPATGYRFYTGRSIRKIVQYEIKKAEEASKE